FDVPGNVPDALKLAAGSTVTVSSQSQLWGLESNFVRNLAHCPHFDGSLIFGFRYLNLGENLDIFENDAGSHPGPTDPLSIADSFRTRNQFYGGQGGGRISLGYDQWTIDIEGKVALGPNFEVANVLGETTFVRSNPTPNHPNPAPGGLFALPGANV